MTRFEYKVIPAPQRGVKVKGAKSVEDRFAHALTELMNQMGRDGWEYQRSDTLPCEERVGLTGRTTRYQNMLVFRRIVSPQFRTTVLPEFVRANATAAEVADVAQAAQPAASSTPLSATRPGTPARVARRLAAALSTRAREGRTPELRTEAAPGAAPKLGGATGQGVQPADAPKDKGPDLAAE